MKSSSEKKPVRNTWKAVSIGCALSLILGMTVFILQLAIKIDRYCMIETYTARLFFSRKDHTALPELLLTTSDLPEDLSAHVVSRYAQHDATEERSGSIEESKVYFDLLYGSGTIRISQYLYWFGSSDNADCKYNRFFTSADVVILPESWEINPPLSSTLSSWKNCRALNQNSETLQCTWIGIFGEYVAELTSPIGPSGLTTSEFDEIILRVDEIMNSTEQ
jgi:hypothetical protein